MAQPLTLSERPAETTPRPEGPLLWLVAFAVGVLIDAVHFAEPPVSLYTIATIAAAGVLLNPWSRQSLLLLTSSLSAAALWYLPDIWNHWVLVGVLGATLTVLALSATLGRGRVGPTNAELVERAAPFLRVSFLTVFFLAAFAKLNTGFLDAASSCATWIIDRVPVVPDVPARAHAAVVGLALITELGIPALLVFRRTRLLGVAVGWSFHLFTALAGHASFAGFAWAFYFLFLPRPVLERTAQLAHASWMAWARRASRRLSVQHPGTAIWIVLGVAWVGLVAVVATIPVGPAGRAQRVVAALLYTAWALWTGALIVRALREAREAGGSRTYDPGFWRIGPGSAVALAVIVLAGLSPYLGFKTQYSFTMYSDLRTESDQWNHLVVPSQLKIGDWQDDLVEVLATDDRTLAHEIDLPGDGSPVLLPLLELRRLSHLHPEAAVTYRYRGVVTETPWLGTDPIVGEDLTWVMRKVARFRPATTPAGTVCQH